MTSYTPLKVLPGSHGAGDPTRVAAGALGTNVGAQPGDLSAYGLKNKAMMLGSASDRFRAANKAISNLVTKMGLPDEIKTTAQVPLVHLAPSVSLYRPPRVPAFPTRGAPPGWPCRVGSQ